MKGQTGGVSCEILSLGHSIAIAVTHSQQLWLPAQDQTSKDSGIDKVDLQTLLLAKELLDSCWGVGNCSIWGPLLGFPYSSGWLHTYTQYQQH